jgi:hypothetical protein
MGDFFVIHRSSLGGVTSCLLRRLVVCYVVIYYICLFYNRFQPYKVIIKENTSIVVALCYFLVFCFEIMLKLG